MQKFKSEPASLSSNTNSRSNYLHYYKESPIPDVINRIKEAKRQFLLKTPIITRYIVYFCLLIFLWSIYNPYLYYKLVNDPLSVVYYSQWYRILSAPYTFRSMFELICGLWIFTIEATIYEKTKGTSRMLGNFLWKNLLINLTFIQVEIYYFSKNIDTYLVWHSFGLWGITLTMIFDRYYSNPEGQTTYFRYYKEVGNGKHLLLYFLLLIIIHRGLRPVDIVTVIIAYVHNEIHDNYGIKLLYNFAFPNSKYTNIPDKRPMDTFTTQRPNDELEAVK
jgi:hypothetical protein